MGCLPHRLDNAADASVIDTYWLAGGPFEASGV